MAWSAQWGPGRAPVMICSLTNAAAARIASKTPSLHKKHVGTIHSMAYRSINSPEVAEAHAAEFNQAYPEKAVSCTTASPENDDTEEGQVSSTPGDVSFHEMNLLRMKMVDQDLWPARVQAFAADWNAWKTGGKYVDFSDMIEIALRDVAKAPGDPRIIILDESQDVSKLEYSLLSRWSKAAGHMILTGDPDQSIFSWRGADPDIFKDPSVGDSHRRILEQSYRVPAAVHAVAVRWIDQITDRLPVTYRPRQEAGQDVPGRVATCPASWQNPDAAIALAEKYLAIGKSVMVLASCSFHLRKICHILKSSGIPFANPWQLSRGDWNPLRRTKTSTAQRMLDFLRADPGTFGSEARLWTLAELFRWTEHLKVGGTFPHGTKGNLAEWAKLDGADEMLCDETVWDTFLPEAAAELRTLLAGREPDSESPETLGHLLGWWEQRLPESRKAAAKFPGLVLERRGVSGLSKPPKLYVGTVHSLKGSEADVTLIFPDLSPVAMNEWKAGGPRRDAIVRLFYVAMTRAKETMVLCGPGSPDLAVDMRGFL